MQYGIQNNSGKESTTTTETTGLLTYNLVMLTNHAVGFCLGLADPCKQPIWSCCRKKYLEIRIYNVNGMAIQSGHSSGIAVVLGDTELKRGCGGALVLERFRSCGLRSGTAGRPTPTRRPSRSARPEGEGEELAMAPVPRASDTGPTHPSVRGSTHCTVTPCVLRTL